MSDDKGVLFVPYQDTLALLDVADALRICEQVYGMHARGSVVLSNPQSFKLDVADGFHNHWHVKSVFLKDIPATGVRLYNYYDDGERNTVGALGCTRYIVLSEPQSGEPLAIVDEHWSYAIRSAAAATIACKWVGPKHPKILGLVGVGTMGTNSLRCLTTMYRFAEVRCTSRRRETRVAFADKWSRALGIPVLAKDSIEEVVRGADIAVGGTTSGEVVSREPWLKPGCTFISLARRELDPAGWSRMDKVVDRQLGIQHAAARVQAHGRGRPVLARCAPCRDPRVGRRREARPRARRRADSDPHHRACVAGRGAGTLLVSKRTRTRPWHLAAEGALSRSTR